MQLIPLLPLGRELSNLESRLLTIPTTEHRLKFAVLLTPLVSVYKPPLTEAQVDVYFGLLCDLPLVAIEAAAIEIAAGRVYSTWPMPGEIRKVALELTTGPAIEWGQAFSLAIRAVANMRDAPIGHLVIRGGKSYGVAEWNQRILEGLPPTVAEALRQFGWRSLREDANSRAQFRDIFNGLSARERADQSRPAVVRRLVLAQTKQIGEGHEISVLKFQGVNQ